MSLQSFFTRFPELPKELQIEIWRFAVKNAAEQATVRNIDQYYFDLRGVVPLLEGPYSLQRIFAERTTIQRMRSFASIINSCRSFRVLSLEYWHEEVKSVPIAASIGVDREFYEKWRKRNVLRVLQEYIEQVRHAMRVDELRAEAAS